MDILKESNFENVLEVMVDGRREFVTHQDEIEKQEGDRLDIIASIIAMSNDIIRLDADNDLLDNVVGLEDVNYYEYTNNLVYEDRVAHRDDDLIYEKDVPQSSNDPIYDVYDESEFESDSLDYGSDDCYDYHQVFEVDNLQEDISDDVIRPYVSQYVRNLMENLRNMPARAQYEDVQINQDDSFVSYRDYDEYTINDPDEEQDNLEDEAEDDEDQEDQGEEDEGPHFIFILVDVFILSLIHI